MKIFKTIKMCMIFAAQVLVSAVLFSGVLQAAVVDRVIVTVNSEVITQSELDRFLQPIAAQLRATCEDEKEFYEKMEDIRDDILNKLIDDRLVLSRAEELEVTVTDDEVQEELDELMRQFSSEESFYGSLKEQGLSLSELKTTFSEQLKKAKVVDDEVRIGVTVMPSEVAEYYQSHLDKYKEAAEVYLRNILVKPDPDEPNPELAKKRAYNLVAGLVKYLKEGANFEEVAQQYSNGPNAETGGDMGYVKRGQMRSEIDSVIFTLGPGEISGIVTTDLGYHILKAEDRKAERIKPLSEVTDEITGMLYNEKLRVKLTEWIKKLRESAYIVIK